MLIALDVETTGLLESDVICSLGLVGFGEDSLEEITHYTLANEGKKIPPKASSIHHITNEMIKDASVLKATEAYQFLQTHNRKETVLIGHHIGFDLGMLSRTGFEFVGQSIDTLRCARHLIKECESYSLQFLRYELKLYKVDTQFFAHHALGDALLVKLLYEYLLELAPHKKLLELSTQKVLLEKFEFGKYSGRYIEEISMVDRAYLEWMIHTIVDLDEDLRYSIDYYLQG
ncbi:MAG: 3'-5' exonuclease [Helicobacteraceae bacterium]|nr:3'-5' exonuclease [Helicobacteraceae bacterium]